MSFFNPLYSKKVTSITGCDNENYIYILVEKARIQIFCITYNMDLNFVVINNVVLSDKNANNDFLLQVSNDLFFTIHQQ